MEAALSAAATLKRNRLAWSEWMAGTVVLVLALTCAALASAETPTHTSTARVVSVAQDFVRAGQLAQATELLESHLAAKPDDNLARLEYARVLMFRRQDASALLEYRKVLHAEPHNPAALVGLAKIASWQGDFAGALELYERVLNRNSRYYDALAGKAFTLRWLARSDEARAAFVELARYHRVDREVAEAMRELGVAAEPAPAQPAAALPAPGAMLPATPSKRPGPGSVEVTKRETVPVVELRTTEAPNPRQPKPVLWAASGMMVALVGFGVAWKRRANRYLRAAVQPMAVLPPPRVIEVPMPEHEMQTRRATLEEPLEGARLLLIGEDEALMNQIADVLNYAGAHVSLALERQQAQRLLAMGEFDALVVQRGAGDEEIYARLRQRGEERCMMLIVPAGETPPMRVLRLNQPFRKEELLSMARLLVRRATRAN